MYDHESKWRGLLKEIKKAILTDFEFKYCKACEGNRGIGTRMMNRKDMTLVLFDCPLKCNMILKICEYFIERNYSIRYDREKGLNAHPIVLIKNESDFVMNGLGALQVHEGTITDQL